MPEIRWCRCPCRPRPSRLWFLGYSSSLFPPPCLSIVLLPLPFFYAMNTRATLVGDPNQRPLIIPIQSSALTWAPYCLSVHRRSLFCAVLIRTGPLSNLKYRFCRLFRNIFFRRHLPSTNEYASALSSIKRIWAWCYHHHPAPRVIFKASPLSVARQRQLQHSLPFCFIGNLRTGEE
ncbi:hypothetical protein LX32DRAFT_313178 [Colletotrichum zoysiae]|uniref:Uncharacterized protein n=1 Tax=Colletotrichum zoysiae TaxID=1216348 RepID=A0AAD9HMW6_9PEZI|nr:hypothetical protein LX32DRAFT_313178 [Colletotrichum zoysiae]